MKVKLLTSGGFVAFGIEGQIFEAEYQNGHYLIEGKQLNYYGDFFDDDVKYMFLEHEIKRVDDMANTEERTKRSFTKSDLRTGDIVTYRDGEKRIVLLNTPDGDYIRALNGYGCNDLSSYKENLTYKSDNYTYRDLDIVIVKRPCRISESLYLNAASKIVFERKNEVPEYTMEELQKKLGEVFKIVK